MLYGKVALKNDSQRLQTLFNYACRIALHCPWLHSSSALCSELGLTSLDVRRNPHQAEMMYKCFNSLAPPYLSSLFQPPSHSYQTRTRHLPNLPRVNTSFGQRAFSFSGLSLWRSIPSSLRSAEGIQIIDNFNQNSCTLTRDYCYNDVIKS